MDKFFVPWYHKHIEKGEHVLRIFWW
jgi:hypothetical protein